MARRCIVFDTNVFESKDGLIGLQHPNWQLFRKIARRLQLQVCIPEMVIQELYGHWLETDQITKSKTGLILALDTITQLANNVHRCEVPGLSEELLVQLRSVNLEKAPEKAPEPMLRDRLIKRLELTVGRAFEILPLPNIDISSVVDRSIRLKRPFQKGGTGFKDFLIWRSIVELVQSSPENEIDFISHNPKDFAENGRLHTDLLEDLAEIDASRLRYFDAFNNFTSQFANEELPPLPQAEANDWVQNLMSGRLPEFNEAMKLAFADIFDELDFDWHSGPIVISNFGPLVLISVHRIRVVDKLKLFIEVNYVWAMDVNFYTLPPFDDSSKPGRHQGFRITIDVVYDHETHQITEAGLVKQEPILPMTLDCEIEETEEGWTITALQRRNITSFVAKFATFEEVEKCCEELGVVDTLVPVDDTVCTFWAMYPVLEKWGFREKPNPFLAFMDEDT